MVAEILKEDDLGKPFDPESSVIVITPTLIGINGKKKKIGMVLDTGATYTMIPWGIAEVLGYTPGLSKKE